MGFYNLRDPRAALRLCVDSVEEGRVSGRVYSGRLRKPLVFRDLNALAVQVDLLLDKQDFPQAFLTTRLFHAVRFPEEAAPDLERGMTMEEVSAAHGAVDTAVMTIHSRKRATWQGRLDWLDGTEERPFESLVELFALLRERLLPDAFL